MQSLWIFFALFSLLPNWSVLVVADVDCLRRDYGRGSVVCVCNEEHCDTVNPLGEIRSGEYVQYTSNQDGLRLKKSTKKIEHFVQNTDAEIIVDGNVRHQRIFGWGGTFTDSTGINYQALSKEVRTKWVDSYFSDDGLEYTLCRVPIGGTDFSTRLYEYAELKYDMDLQYFDLAPEDYLYKIPLITAAKNASKRSIKLIGSAWSAPKWMKTNGELTGVGFLKKDMYQVWAKYHLKFLDMYKVFGIDFWALTTGNEPSNGFLPRDKLNSMGWSPATMSKWIRENIGPSLKNSTHANTKLLTLDDQRFFMPWWIDMVLADKEVMKYIDGVAIHWYWDKVFPASLLDMTHKNHPDKFLLNTEATIGEKFWQENLILGSWERAENYVSGIIENINHWSTGWIDWNMALDLEGGPNWAKTFVDAPIIVNATANEFYKQPTFYSMAHFSKFLPPNSVRVQHTIDSPHQIQVMTLKRPDNKTVVVLLNKAKDTVAVSVRDGDKVMNVDLEKRSINTIIY